MTENKEYPCFTVEITLSGEWVSFDFIDEENRDLMVKTIKKSIKSNHLLWVKEENAEGVNIHHIRTDRIARFSFYQGIRTCEIKPIEWEIIR